VSLSQVQLTSIVTGGTTATLYGTAQLADGAPVSFELDATAGRILGRAQLHLSTGYDSGSFLALVVIVGP
jgi:hypothetical protein